MLRNSWTSASSNWESSKVLKMGPIGCPETSVTNYQSTLHIKSQKSVDFMYTVAVSCNHATSELLSSHTQGPSHFSDEVFTRNYTRNFRTRWNTDLNAPPELIFVFLDEINDRFVDIITASNRCATYPTLRLSLTETSLSISVYPQALHQHVQHLLQTIQTRQQQLVPKTAKSTVEVQFISQDVQVATYGHGRVDAASCIVTSLATQDGSTRRGTRIGPIIFRESGKPQMRRVAVLISKLTITLHFPFDLLMIVSVIMYLPLVRKPPLTNSQGKKF